MSRTNNSTTQESSGYGELPKSSNNNNQPKVATPKQIIKKIVLDVNKLKNAGLDRRIAEALSRQKVRQTMTLTNPSSSVQQMSETSDAVAARSVAPILTTKDTKTMTSNVKVETTTNASPQLLSIKKEPHSRYLVLPKITITEPVDLPLAPSTSTHTTALEHMDSKQRLEHAKMLLKRKMIKKKEQSPQSNQLSVPKASVSRATSSEQANTTTSPPVILNFLNNKQRVRRQPINLINKNKDVLVPTNKSNEFRRSCPINMDSLQPQRKLAATTTATANKCSSPIVLENKVLSQDEKIDLRALRLSTYQLKTEENITKTVQNIKIEAKERTTQPTKIILSAAKLKRSPDEIAALAKQIQSKLHAGNKASSGEKPLFKWNALKSVRKKTEHDVKDNMESSQRVIHSKSKVYNTESNKALDNHSSCTQHLANVATPTEATELSSQKETAQVVTRSDPTQSKVLTKSFETNSLPAQTEDSLEIESSSIATTATNDFVDAVTNSTAQVHNSNHDFDDVLQQTESIDVQPPVKTDKTDSQQQETKVEATSKEDSVHDTNSSAMMSAVDFIAALTAEHPITESTEMELSPEELNLNATFEMGASPLSIPYTMPQKIDVDVKSVDNIDNCFIPNADISIGQILPLNDVDILDVTMDEIDQNILCIRSPNEPKIQHLEQLNTAKPEESVIEAEFGLESDMKDPQEPVANSAPVSELAVEKTVEKTEEFTLDTQEKDKKNTEVGKRPIRSKKGKINLVQRIKKIEPTKKIEVVATKVPPADCKDENGPDIDLPTNGQDNVVENSFATNEQESIIQKSTITNISTDAEINIDNVKQSKDLDVETTENAAVLEIPIPKNQEENLSSEVSNHKVDTEHPEDMNKSTVAEKTLLQAVLDNNFDNESDNGPPQIPFKTVSNTEEELQKETPVGIKSLLNQKLQIETAKSNETTNEVAKESIIEPKIESRAPRKKIFKARPLLSTKRPVKKEAAGKKDHLVSKEKCEESVASIEVDTHENEVDIKKHNKTETSENSKDDTNDEQSKAKEIVSEAEPQSTIDCSEPAIIQVSNQSEQNDDCKNEGENSIDSENVLKNFIEDADMEIVSTSLSITHNDCSETAMDESITTNDCSETTKTESIITNDCSKTTSKKEETPINEHEVVVDNFEDNINKSENIVEDCVKGITNVSESRTTNDCSETAVEESIATNDCSESTSKKEQNAIDECEDARDNSKDSENKPKNSIEDAVMKQQLSEPQSELEEETTNVQMQATNDSCDDETPKDESSQDESLALSERKRLRKTLEDYSKKAKPLPLSDSDDDNSVNDFYGFDEDSIMNTELQNNLLALNETSKTMKDKSTLKTSTLKNWLTTGKAVSPTPKPMETMAVGRGIPPKKRWDFIKNPSNETDVTDDTSPVDDENIELSALKKKATPCNDSPNQTVNDAEVKETEETTESVISEDKPNDVDNLEKNSTTEVGLENDTQVLNSTVEDVKVLTQEEVNDSGTQSSLPKKIRSRSRTSKTKEEPAKSVDQKDETSKTVPSKKRKRVASPQNLPLDTTNDESMKLEAVTIETPEEIPKKRGRRARSKEKQTIPIEITTSVEQTKPQQVKKRSRSSVIKNEESLTIDSAQSAAAEPVQARKRSRRSLKKESSPPTIIEATNNNSMPARTMKTRVTKKTKHLTNNNDNQATCSNNENTNDTPLMTESTPKQPEKRRKIKCEEDQLQNVASTKVENAPEPPLEISTPTNSKKRGAKQHNNEALPTKVEIEPAPVETSTPTETKNRIPKNASTLVCNFNSRLLLIRKREELNNDTKLTVRGGSGPLQCGLCLARTSKESWMEHQATHYGVGWLADETPLNVSSRTVVLNTITNYFRATGIKGINCRLCGRAYRSSLGLIQHVEMCGEVQQRVECCYCKRSYTKFSLVSHERTCPSRSKVVKEEEVAADENDIASVSYSNSGRQKRVSTIKAESKLKKIGKELTVQADSELPSFDPNEYIKQQQKLDLAVLKAQWSEELKTLNQATCPEKLCTFSANDLAALEKHVSACDLVPKPGYHCKVCKAGEAIFTNKKNALKHVRQKHKPQGDFDADGSDYDAKGDKESSDEYESSGVDSDDDAISTESSDLENSNIAKIRKQSALSAVEKQLFPGRQKELDKLMAYRWRTFIEKNYAKDLLFDYAAPKSCQTVNTSEVEKLLPKPTKSLNFCYYEKTDIPINFGSSSVKRDWTQLELYNSTHGKNEHFLYIGASVRQIAWLPLPPTVEEQFLVCSYRKFEQYSRQANPKIGDNVIFLLKFMPTDGAATWQLNSSVHYGIRTHDGAVQSFALMPSGGYDVTLNRLGLLAIGSDSPNIKIYALPLVFEKNSDGDITILDLKPAMVLTFDLQPQNLENKLCNELQCMQICWDESRNHNLIAAGFANGCIGFWNIEDNEDDNLNRFLKEDDVRFFVPVNFFYFGEKCIRFLALHYGTEGACWLAAASTSRKYGIYDIRNLLAPRLLCGEVSTYLHSCIDWSPMWETVSIGCSDVLSKLGGRVLSINPTAIVYTHACMDTTQCTPRTAHYSPDQLVQAIATDNGDVIILNTRELHLETNFQKVTSNNRALSLLDVQTLSGAESVQQSEANSFTDHESNFREKYGIVFRPLIKVPQDKRAHYHHVKRRPPANLLKYMRVNCVRFNYNKVARKWLAVGCENGFIRIINFKRESYFGSS